MANNNTPTWEKILISTASNSAAVGDWVGAGVAALGVVATKMAIDAFSNDETNTEKTLYNKAWDAYNNNRYEEALAIAQQCKKNFKLFDYYYFCGYCHWHLRNEIRKSYWEQKEHLGLDEDSDPEDSRWDEIAPIWDEVETHRVQAYDNLKECIRHQKDTESKVIGDAFSKLEDVCTNIIESRRYATAAMMDDDTRTLNRDLYNEYTEEILESFDSCYEALQEECHGTEEEKKQIINKLQKNCFTGREYSERQFIYIAKNVDSLAGCYDENVQWLFTINQLPKELKFPIGHPQPNSLYYAHPAKRGEYFPIGDADEELFKDKVRDFCRLVQCLGATEITFKSIKGHSILQESSTGMDVEGGGTYKGVGGSVGYGNTRGNKNASTQQQQKTTVEKYDPIRYPYLPDEQDWLNVDKDWQAMVKKRMEGNQLHYSVRISSRQTMSATDSRMDEVRLAMQTFVVNANAKFTTQMEKSFQREEETIWEINVTFKPLNEFSENVFSTSKNNFNKNEQEYLDNLKEFLEDDAEITPRERKMLDRIRQSLDISEERAQELEASLKPQLTEDEQEYLDMYREYKEKGEITEKERRRLDKFANALGISEERVKQMELI